MLVPTRSAGALSRFPRFCCLPDKRHTHARARAFASPSDRCKRHTRTHAMLTINNRLSIAFALRWSHDSISYPAPFIRLKNDSIFHRQSYHCAISSRLMSVPTFVNHVQRHSICPASSSRRATTSLTVRAFPGTTLTRRPVSLSIRLGFAARVIFTAVSLSDRCAFFPL